ncbi:hypothetical protein C8R48DRAFT_716026 [Suillus tomentosus]|nr:hypothetical protein C8R48DRAFT_716026 [Suillus tomentosus]
MADASNLAAKMDYSRQLYCDSESNVLIVGLQGLELTRRSRNVCLAGVKSVTLYDPEPPPVTVQDLSSQVCA